ncbi:4-(cytidine 5'-diphospho)-2-C-methyl-D-erythritol kinase [Natronoflexus pectinivorans]|uniref:4-diphosphocytidyl-2-C-methyl-D-erythritol kinase n=1 Tax=Natronoflexus pectinivorans TaxID=682526 RepID=A0A4R2GH10_9BACT|nr:4-(cytidine 5'-diphospho)-2-C-methyl-D-erythritol kinase [Natronoflexus pectinivorans]TCO07666.1 4-diphosphocytidyl-2-C-methyl-D-erythritol kinase [Natronoflexus pectinivorans]
MIVFPNAKINLGLNIVSKRNDGYHNLETVFFPVKKWNDVLEVIPSTENSDEFSVSGLNIDGSSDNNLCMKALTHMRQHTSIPPLKIHLHKVIPFGAGLGGGSADAAFMLKLLNEQFQKNFSSSDLEKMAATLGADCPVFIKNQAVMARGIGNEFSGISLQLKSLWLLIVAPGIHVSTAEAYGGIIPKSPSMPINEILTKPIKEWRKFLKNDFEDTVFQKHPAIAEIKENFYRNGAIYASMSGSGSAVYGLFKDKPEITWSSTYVTHLEEIS